MFVWLISHARFYSKSWEIPMDSGQISDFIDQISDFIEQKETFFTNY